MRRMRSIGVSSVLLLALFVTVFPCSTMAQEPAEPANDSQISDAIKKAVKEEVKAALAGANQKKNECKEPTVSFSNLTNDTYYSATFRSDPAARYYVCFYLTEGAQNLFRSERTPVPTQQVFSADARLDSPEASALWTSCETLVEGTSGNGSTVRPLSLIAAAQVQAEKDTGSQMPIRLQRPTFDQLLRHEGWVAMYYQSVEGDCEEEVSGWRIRPMFERHSLQVGLGAAYRQQEEGGFDSQIDLGMNVQSRWRSRWSTAFDLRLLGLGESSEASTEPAMDDSQETMTETRATEMMKKEDDFNPFEKKGVFAQADLWGGLHLGGKGAFALVAGAGVRTVPGSEDNGAEARGRFMLGFRIDSAGLNIKQDSKSFGRAKHSLTVAYSYDRAWQLPEPEADADPEAPALEEELDRLWIDARLTLFESDQQTFRLVPRITFDTPVDGDGPSDLRIAIMGAVDLDKLIGWGQVKN